MRELSRREFLRDAAWAGGALAAGSLLPRMALAGVRPRSLDPGPFHFGVASGDPLPDAVVIWTRVAARRRVGVRWQVARDADFRRIVRTGTAEAGPARDHTVSVDVSGLEPGTTHWYRFGLRDDWSRPGRTRTAPAGSPRRLRFALASCQDFQAGHYAAWRHIAGRPLDFVLHVGDYIYEYADDGDRFRPHRPAHEILTLEDYRTRYANYRSDPFLRAAHAAHPFVSVWDDHEVANDRWQEGAENHQDEEGEYAAREAAAYRAWREWMPVRLPAPRRDPGRIYRRFAFGDLADLFALDTRQYRDEPQGTFLAPNADPALSDPERTILGKRQERWLKRGLSRSGARWRLLGNQVMIAHLKYGNTPDELARPLSELTGLPRDGLTANPDQWDGYQPERRDLLEHIRDRTPGNTVFLTGDIHTSWANELYVNPGNTFVEEPVAAEFVGPSITSINLNELMGTPPRTTSVAVEEFARANNPHIRWAELDSNGYVLVTVTRDRVRGDWHFLSDVRDRKAKQALAASWEVREGDARLHERG